MDPTGTRVGQDQRGCSDRAEWREGLICCMSDWTLFGGLAIAVNDMIDPEILEAMACNEALSLALDLNVQNIQMSTHIQEKYLRPSEVMIDGIKMKLSLFSSATVIHEKRDGNVESHMLAKVLRSQELLVLVVSQ